MVCTTAWWECKSLAAISFINADSQVFRTWAMAAAMGPLIGGALSSEGQWRWLFCKYSLGLLDTPRLIFKLLDLNIPLVALAAGLVVSCLQLRTPAGTFKEKVGRMDWM